MYVLNMNSSHRFHSKWLQKFVKLLENPKNPEVLNLKQTTTKQQDKTQKTTSQKDKQKRTQNTTYEQR